MRCTCSNFRAWLHGEFQPGLKFRSAHRAEILLRLHGQFQPGRKTLISVRKFTEVRKHACSRSFFQPGLKKWEKLHGFFSPFGRAENPSPVFSISARDEIRHGDCLVRETRDSFALHNFAQSTSRISETISIPNYKYIYTITNNSKLVKSSSRKQRF